MCCRSRSPGDDVALVTFQLRYQWQTINVAITVMHAAGMLMDKIRRRRINKDSALNGHEKLNEIDARRKSPRISLRRRPTLPEKMNHAQDGPEDYKSKFDRHVRSSTQAQDYAKRKRQLLDAERRDAWDQPARMSASEAEVKANEILLKVREYERDTLFGNLPSEDIPGLETRDMGGRFLVSKPRIEDSAIFKAAKQMPKGAHLHLHFNSEIPPEKLLPLARDPKMEDTMCVRSTKALLEPEDFNQAEFVFEVKPRSRPKGNIFSKDYDIWSKEKEKTDPKNASWMRWVDFRQQWPGQADPKEIKIETRIGDAEGLEHPAEYWAREKMVMTLERAYHDRQTTNGAWACFNIGTRAFKGLLGYESVYRWYIGNAVESMIRDKVMYAELRPMLLDKFLPSDDGTRQLDHHEQMKIICQEVKAKQDKLHEDGKLDQFPFGLKIIYSTPRSIDESLMEKELANCIELKLAFPELICGFDLVGAEDRKNNIGFYANLLVAFTETCEELNIEIPFMFHAGETLIDTGGSHDPDKSNLYDALLLNARRIGHGYSLLKHPVLAEKYKKQNICLELCPISNELLHLCGNARQHIFPELLAAGLHCTLNADNPSLFSSSLSHEFYQVMVGDTRMSVHGWKQLALWSLEHACLTIEEQERARKIFSRDWEIFCQWIVDTYADSASALAEIDVMDVKSNVAAERVLGKQVQR